MNQENQESDHVNKDELEERSLDLIVAGIDTVPLPERPMSIGTWPTPERSYSFFTRMSFR